jgi:hypothetical protein
VTHAPFVASLRTSPDTIRIPPDGTSSITIRVQLAEAWDAARVQVAPDESVSTVKARALEVLDPAAASADEYDITNRGIKIWNESQSLAAAGVVDGATLLIEFRHRRPVR